MEDLEYFSVKTIRAKYKEYDPIQGTGTIIKSQGQHFLVTALHNLRKIVNNVEVIPADWQAMSGTIYLPDNDVQIHVTGVVDVDEIKDWAILRIESPVMDYDFSRNSHLDSKVVANCEYAGYGFPHNLETGTTLCFKPSNKRDEEWLLQGIVEGASAKANTIEKGASGMGLYRQDNEIYICLGIINQSLPNGAFNGMRLIKVKEFASYFPDIFEGIATTEQPAPAASILETEAAGRILATEQKDEALISQFVDLMELCEYDKAWEVADELWKRHPANEWMALNFIRTTALTQPERLPELRNVGLYLNYSTSDSVMFAARSFGKFGYPQIAADIMYSNAQRLNDTVLDSMIYAETVLDSYYYNPIFRKEYEVVEEGCCVLYADETNNKRHCIMASDGSVMGSAVMGHKKDDVVVMEIAGDVRRVVIISIFSKYFMIVHRAIEDIMEYGGNRVMTPYKLEGDARNQEAVIEMFKKIGIDLTAPPADPMMEAYKEKPSLITSSKDDDFIGSFYRMLFSDFPLLGREDQLFHPDRFIHARNGGSLVLDLSSLLVMFEQSMKGVIMPKKKFIISRYIYEMVKNYRRNFVSIASLGMQKTLEAGRIHIFSDDYLEDMEKRFDGMIAWINRHCEIKSSERYLKVLKEARNPKINEYCRLSMQTFAFLTEDPFNMLVTEDWYIKKLLGDPICMFNSKEVLDNIQLFDEL